jgi:hypothetical protein
MPGSSDILMMLVKGTSGIPAESQTVLGRSDNLLSLPGKPAFKAGEFFELDNFTLSLTSPPHDATADGSKTVTIRHEGGDKKGGHGGGGGPKLSRDTKWLPAHLQQVSCSRQLDYASSELFAQVGKDSAFASAAIVRRKVVGGLPKGDGSNLMGYFRLDFTTVTITDVGWSADEDGVKETLQFVCKAAEVVYRQQSHTGEMGKIFPPGKWP